MTEAARPYTPAPGGTLSRKTRDALFQRLGEFAPKASTDMGSRLGLPVKIAAKSVDVVIGAKHQIEGAITVDFSISPGPARGFMGVDPGVARLLVESSFGGAVPPVGGRLSSELSEEGGGAVPPVGGRLSSEVSGEGGGTDSPGGSARTGVTPVERRVTEGFMEYFLSRLNAFWETLGECAFSPIRSGAKEEVKPARRDSEETYVVFFFQVLLQGTARRLEVGFPLPFVKPLTSGLEAPAEKSSSMADDPKLHPVLKRKMEGVLVDIRAFLAEPDVFLREMADLEPGDVLPVGKLGAEAVLLAGVVPMFRGQAGVLNGHRAIRISGVAKTDRRLP